MSVEYDLCSSRMSAAAKLHVPCERSFTVEVFSDLGKVDAIWAKLESTAHCTPFQTRAWLAPWFRNVAPRFRATPAIAVVRDARTAAVVMLLPLCRRTEGIAAIVEFADLGVSDYNAPIMASGHPLCSVESASLRAQLTTAFPGSDLLRLEKAPVQFDGARNPLASWAADKPMAFASWGVDLPADRDTFDRLRLDPSFAKELKKKKRRLGARGEVRFSEAVDAIEKCRVFSALCAQRAARFAELGRSNILGDRTFQSFYEDAIHAPGSVCRLFSLSVGDEIVATIFGLDHRKRFHLIMSTIGDDRWKSCSPGNVAMDELTTLLINSGHSYLDFTIGDEAYKRSFGATSRPINFGLSALSWRGSPHVAIHCAKSVARDRLGALSNGLAGRLLRQPRRTALARQ